MLNLIVIKKWLDNIQNPGWHFIHFIKNKDVMFTLCHISRNPVAQLKLKEKK